MNVDARSTLTAIVCAYNEEKSLPAALHSLFAQTRVPDEVIVVNNASTDRTRVVAERIPGVVVVDEPEKGLVRARAKGLSVARGDILLYIDADCRAPLRLVERMERQFLDASGVVAVLARTASTTGTGSVSPGRACMTTPSHRSRSSRRTICCGWARCCTVATLRFGVRRWRQSVASTRGSSSTARTNLGRRLAMVGRVTLKNSCFIYTSARRYKALGRGRVFRLYVRNFWWETVHHRPKDLVHEDVRL